MALLFLHPGNQPAWDGPDTFVLIQSSDQAIQMAAGALVLCKQGRGVGLGVGEGAG